MDEGHDGKEIEHKNDEVEPAGEDLDQAEQRMFLEAMQGEITAGTTRRGEMVKGSIVAITDDFAVVDLGGKSEGILSLAELKRDDDKIPAVGDEVEACVLSNGADGLILSQQLAKGIHDREFLDEAARSKIPVQGRVISRNKGGFDVEVAGLRGFCPISQIELRYCEDPDVHLEQKYNFLITKYDTSGRRPDMVLSRRALLEAEAKKMAAELLKNLAEGDILNGTIRSIRDFGAFVDLGGLDGLLPVSEISYERVADPRDVLTEGEEIHVQVISIEQGGERITLSLKRLEIDPWDEALMNFPEGSRQTGKVVRLEPFGAFVQLGPGVDGLIHISNLNVPERVSHPRNVLQLDEEVSVEVLSVDPQQRRIGLARVPGDGEFGEVPVAGAVVEGKVDSVVNFGVFVTLGPGRKGLVPNVEMGTSKGTDHRKQFKPGTPIKVKVLEVTENGRRISLSRQAALQEVERADFDKYVEKESDASSAGFGTLGDLLKEKK
ncbi:MAG TPA: S1 RNA-binding domain-containing protein [Myxococcota bacterium]|nr:S1 RNA-binding domain-containing protein [Myxococcota bacterium]